MKEFIDKLTKKLYENVKSKVCPDEACWAHLNKNCDNCDSKEIKVQDVILIANELAEEYKLFGNSEQVKVSEMPTGWISVSERLPSESGKYLVTAKNITGWWILDNNVFVCDYAHDTFIFQGWEDNEVIAWMPLPAPYTEGE
jgi:hypothetical protein